MNLRMLFGGALTLSFISGPGIVLAQGATSVLTPIVFKVLEAPQPVKGSDGAYHLVYELEMTNASATKWQVKQIEVLARAKAARPAAVYSGDALQRRMALLSSRKLTTSLTDNQTGIVWLHLVFPTIETIPKILVHRLQITSDGKSLWEQGGSLSVGQQRAISVAPPLKGGRWVAADGCCDSHRHVRALLPVNGRLRTAQRFAIDWELLNEKDRIYHGDKLRVESYFAYGQEILAVADGKVVAAVDGLPNQVPGKLPDNLPVEQADGNHVIQDLGGGRYALYAHLIPGSLRVKTGDTVKKGDVLGLVGNSGNTLAPHLHFHIMDAPSTLDSNGLPYVLDSFELMGKAASTRAFDQAEAEGTALKILPVKPAGQHHQELPLDLSIVQLR